MREGREGGVVFVEKVGEKIEEVGTNWGHMDYVVLCWEGRSKRCHFLFCVVREFIRERAPSMCGVRA